MTTFLRFSNFKPEEIDEILIIPVERFVYQSDIEVFFYGDGGKIQDRIFTDTPTMITIKIDEL